MSLYALDTGRIVRSRSNEDLQAAGWIMWAPGGGWRLTRAGRRYIQRLLEVYTRGGCGSGPCAGSGRTAASRTGGARSEVGAVAT